MNKYKSVKELPLILSASDVSKVLNVCRSKSYELMNSTYFPSKRIGRKLIVTKYSFLKWLDGQSK